MSQPIHVDVGDEVPAIIERIRRSDAEEVHLVLPPHARFGQSRFNFQLLRQYSTRLGKRVAIWSPDPAVQRLAEESGFGGFAAPQASAPGPRPAARPVASAAASPGQPAAAPRPLAGHVPQGRPPATVPPAGVPPPGMAVPPPGIGVPPPAMGPPPGAPGPGSRLPAPLRLGTAGQAAQAGGPARIRIGAPRRLPSHLARYQPYRYALYAAAALVLLAGIVLVMFYVPSARVTLVAQAQPFSTSVDITTDPGKQTVRVRPVSIGRSLSLADLPATGNKTTPGQLASGQFTYVNNCPQDLQIPSGQRLISVTGVAFAQLGDAEVGHNQQKSVDIKAVQAGANGNVQPGQITGIDKNGFACLTGTNQGPTQGGTDDQKQTVIQSSDVQGAKAELERQLRQQMIDELKKGIQRGETLAPQPTFTKEDFSTTHNVDDAVGKFTATLNLTAEGDYFMGDDVDKAFSDKLDAKVPADKQLTTNKVIATYTVTAAAGGHLEFAGSANGYIAPKIEVDKVKSQLAGKPAAQAHDVLTRLPIQRSVIDQSPPLPLMPLSASRIYIDYGVEAATPAKSS